MRRSAIVSTQKKSQARMPAAWACRNSRHDGPPGRGAGSRPARSNTPRTVLGPTLIPSFRKLAGDPRVAPARVLPRETQDQVAALRRDRWPAGTAEGITPALPSELAMPANERRRRHDQPSAALRLEQMSKRREERPIGPAKPRPRRAATEDRNLVTEDKELSFALHAFAPKDEQAKRCAEREVDESEGHSRMLPTLARACSTAASENWNHSRRDAFDSRARPGGHCSR